MNGRISAEKNWSDPKLFEDPYEVEVPWTLMRGLEFEKDSEVFCSFAWFLDELEDPLDLLMLVDEPEDPFPTLTAP